MQSIFTFEKKGYLNREDSYEIFYKYREPDNHKYFDEFLLKFDEMFSLDYILELIYSNETKEI